MHVLVAMIALGLVIGLAGCSRAWWAPETDKAITERAQAKLAEREVIAIERIANSIERIEKALNTGKK